MDMMQGPTPPTVAALAVFDANWNGAPHRNICVKMREGSAIIHVNGMPDFQVYYVPTKKYTYARETPGRIEIDTPDAPHLKGTVCLGIGEK